MLISQGELEPSEYPCGSSSPGIGAPLGTLNIAAHAASFRAMLQLREISDGADEFLQLAQRESILLMVVRCHGLPQTSKHEHRSRSEFTQCASPLLAELGTTLAQ